MSNSVKRAVEIGEQYEEAMLKILASLDTIRRQGHLVNQLTREDWEIAQRHGIEGFWGGLNTMIFNGWDLAEFADLALRELAVRLPDLYEKSGITFSLDGQ